MSQLDIHNSVETNTVCHSQERRKQQDRFTEAQMIQREMSQLEMQREELEEYSREIEYALRDPEDGKYYT